MEGKTIDLYHNCNIITVDENNTIAEAMATLDGRILAIGALEDLEDQVTKASKETPGAGGVNKIDLNGGTVLPGFIDAHLHPGVYVVFKTQLNLSGIRSITSLQEILKKEDKIKKLNQWILGFDLMEDLFDDPAERIFPDRAVLDACCPDRHVVILRHDAHICSVNSRVLETLGIDKEYVKAHPLKGGEIRIDPEGEPTGIFTEEATAIVLDAIPVPDMQSFASAAKEFSDEITSFGITTCGAILQLGQEGLMGKAGALELPLVQQLIKEDLIKPDLAFYLITNKPKKLKRARRAIQSLSEREYRFELGGLKTFADGSFGARTACMHEPFSDSTDGVCGFMVRDQDTLVALFREALELDFQVACHAIGDRANREVVDAFKKVQEECGKMDLRNRIEHASQITDDTLADAAKLGLVIVTQPAFINSEYTWLENRMGPDRIKDTYPFKSIIDHGIVLAGASDAPIESASILAAIQACVTRKGFVPEQSIGVMDAIRMFTWNAAYSIRQEHVKGSLEPGKLADFVVLGKDPNTVSREEIEGIKIVATYQRGKKVYSRE
ncbi:MAG: amidohydrolase [Candidatus Hodarchaeota archaeon]